MAGRTKNPFVASASVPETPLAATAKVGLWDWNIVTDEVKWTDAVYRIHGVDRDTFVVTRENFIALIHPEDLPRVQAAIGQALETDAPYELEFRVRRPDGTISWVFTNGTVVRQDGKPVRMIGATLDITASRRADDAVRRLAAVVESTDDAILCQDLDGVITTWNAGAQRLFGYAADEIIGRHVSLLIPPELAAETPDMLARIRRGEHLDHFETFRQRKDGTRLRVSLTVSPLKDFTGQIAGASKIVRDITRQHQAELDRNWLAAIVTSSEDAIISKDLSGMITSWNAMAEEMFGYSAAEAIGRPVTMLIPPQRQNEEPTILARIRAGERIEYYEAVRQRKNGAVIDVALTVSPIKDAHGNVIGASKIIRNITGQKLAQEQLRLSEERFRLLSNHAPVGIFLSDQDGRCVFVNERWCQMTGLTADQALGDGWASALHPDDRPIVLAGWNEAVRDSTPSSSEFRFVRPDGSVVWVQGSAVQFKDGDRFRGYLGSCIDVTERKQAELQTIFLHRLTDSLSGLTEPDQIMDEGQAALAAYLEADRVYFFEIMPERGVAVVRRDWRRPAFAATEGTHRLENFGSPEFLAMLSQPRSMIADLSAHPITQPHLASYAALNMGSLATSTFSKDGKKMLSLAVSTRAPRVWTSSEMDLIENVTARVWPIIERARAAQELRASERLHRAIGDSINYGVWVCDAQGSNTYASDSFLKLVGITQAQCSGLGWMEFLHPDDIDATLAAWKECTAKEELWEREHRFKGVDGHWHPILARGVPIRDDAGKVVSWIGINLDISAFKQSQFVARQRMETMERLNVVGRKLVAEHEIDKIVQLVTDTGREVTHAAFGAFFYNVVNEQGESYTLYTLSGIPREAFAGLAMPRATTMFGPTFRGESPIRVADVTQDPRYGKNPPHHGMPAGHPPVRSYLAVPVNSRSGEVLGGLFFGHPDAGVFTEDAETVLVGLASQAAIAIDNAKLYAQLQRELLDQKRSEALLRDSESRWRQLADAMPHLVWTCRPDGYCDFLSPQWVAYTGVPEIDQLGEGWMDFVHPEDRDELAARWTETVQTGDVFDTEFRIRRADGKYRSFKTRAVPVRDNDGRIVKWYGTNTDIEEFRRIEQAIRKSEHQLRFVTDHAPVYLVQCDLDHHYRFVNRPYAERYGRTREDLIGRHVSEFAGKEAYATFKVHMDACLTGRRVEFEQEIPYSTLGPRWVHVIYEPEHGPEGDVVGLVAVIVDVTARKQVEFELAKARDEALAASRAKDDFLATLSHELRTPLSPVLLIASDAANNPSLPRDIRESFELIRTNVSLEARLIDDLLDLTRITRGKMPLEKHLLDVHDVMRDAIANIRQDIDAKEIEFELRLDAQRSTIMGDPVRLQQVIWNILKNAVKFTPEGGRIGIVTEFAPEPDRMTIEVSDTGIGMSPSELARVFEAFMQGEHASGNSGSSRFGGLGLGLAISQKLVELHGGRIYATSAGRNRGSIFVIELPITLPPLPGDQLALPTLSAAPSPVTSTGSILLVEDHPSTRDTLQKLLTRRNYEVVAAGSLAEARGAIAGRQFDFLVSDVGLPDGDGYQLMRELRLIQPTLQGIAISGYGMEDDLQRSHAAGFAAHLVKPVGIKALERALAGLVRIASS